MSYVYVGTDNFAASVLQQLVEGGSPPALVISRPDAPKGRGRKLGSPPVVEAARDAGIEVIQPEDIGSVEVDEAIDAIDPSCLALCAYGAIIREPLLSKRPILNLHPSLLPRWRGATPIEQALLAGDAESGVSIIRLVEALDAGPVQAQESVVVEQNDDFESLSSKLIRVGAVLLKAAIEKAEEGTLEFADQAGDGATYAERIESADRFLDQTGPVLDAERKVRALTPHVGARLALDEAEPIGVRKASISTAEVAPGQILFGSDELLVGFSDGTLKVERVLPPGGREMDTADWLRGR